MCDRQHGAGHGVEAGGEHEGVHLDVARGGLDAGGGDALDGLLAQADQRDVGKVVGGVVVGVQARALGAEGQVFGRQGVGGGRVLHRGANLLGHQLAHQRIALDVEALVGP
jgi:hypothetical protein